MEAYNFIPCLILIFVPYVVGGKVPAIIVLGDSTVDTGNNNQIITVLKSNFPPYGGDFFDKKATGRFCNGRIPPDLISEAFGLRPFVPAYLDPMYNITDFAAGVCFASAGTGYDNATSHVLNVMPLWKEIENYKEYQKKLEAYVGITKSKYIIQEALYIVSMGTNDFLENYYALQSVRAFQYTPQQYQDFIIQHAEDFTKQIYNLGARKISLTGLPPMGCLPLERAANMLRGHGDTCNDQYNECALQFNVKLSALIQKLNKELPGIRVVFANPYNIILQMVQNPSSFGFEVAQRACCGTGLFEMSYLCNKLNPLTCPDPNKFIFWDSFHLTQKTNQIITNSLMKNVLNQFM